MTQMRHFIAIAALVTALSGTASAVSDAMGIADKRMDAIGNCASPSKPVGRKNIR